MEAGHTIFSPAGLGVSVGIYALSSSSHSTIPPIRASLQDKGSFAKVLAWTFGCILASYLVLSASAYYYFGDSVAELLTDSFALSRLGTTYLWHPALNFSSFISALLGAKSLIMVLVSIMAQQTMVLELLYGPSDDPKGGASERRRPWVELGIRMTIFVGLLLVGLLGRRQIAVFESLVGGCACLTCSLVLPMLVYGGMFWWRMGLV